MAVTRHLPNLLLSSFLLISHRALATAGVSDTLNEGRNITDGDTLVSSGGSFTLGFFSPGVSTKRYLGVWFSVSSDAVCWVANRDRPLNSKSGVLVFSNTGNLLLVDGSGQTVWISNSSSAGPAVAQLLESGNLLIREQSGNTTTWQSFDSPSDTLLPGMKMGKDLWKGTEWRLSSWRSADDPSPTYRFITDVDGLPDNVLWDGNDKVYRTGPWNGVRFSGVTEAGTYTNMFTFHMTINSDEVTFGYTANPGAPLSRIVVTDARVVKRLVWEASGRKWQPFFQGPRDICDDYAKCGPFGLCNANAASTSFCSCVKGFTPAYPSAWSLRETSGGCRRSVALDCGKGNGSTTDGFLVLQGIKLPDTHNASVDTRSTLEECSARCLANCSCLAYAPADIGGGGAGTGCVIWTGNLTDLRYVDGGQDLYVRLPKSELDEAPHRKFPTGLVVGALASLIVVLLVVFLVVIVKRRQVTRIPDIGQIVADDPDRPLNPSSTVRSDGQIVADDPDSPLNPASTVRSVPAVDLPTIRAATGNFSESNIIGRGEIGDISRGPRIPDNGQIVADDPDSPLNPSSAVRLDAQLLLPRIPDNGHRVADDPDSPLNPASTVRSVPTVDLPTIQAATGNFSESNIIGRGGFGIVYEGKLPDGRKGAVKRLRQSLLTDKGKEDFTREVQVMSKLRHVNLVELLCHCQEGDEWILVYEVMQKKSLNLYIFGEDTRDRSSLNWVQRREIIRGIAVGVAYLHDKQVIHRDLKPSNILLDDTWKPKIADFGTAKLFIDDQTNPTLVLSPGYTAPEYVDPGHLTLKCDVYSFGVVLLEIVSGKRRCTVPTFLADAWESWTHHEIVDLVDLEVGQPEPELLLGLERCIQIGLLCVQLLPEDRPTMSEVVSMLTNSSSQLAMPTRPTVNARAGVSFRETPDARLFSRDWPGPSQT